MLKKICLLLWLSVAFAAPAQSPPTRYASGRFLFIVDTSAAMRNRSSAVQKALSTLLLSGMDGQLQPGDTIGVWTYNERLYAGHLPLQQWTPQNEQLVASNILAFLGAQKFEKESHFNVVQRELEPLVKESEKLTVLLVSAGSDNISGTPFDASINALFKRNARQQKQKRMPFITVLRSYRGKFTGATMNLAPWPVEYPSFPPEASLAAKPAPKPPIKETPAPTAPPLIVIGKKPEPASVAPTAHSNSTPATSASSPAPTTAATEPAPTQPAETTSPKPDVSPEPTPGVKPAVLPVAPTPKTTPTSPSVIASSTEPSHASTLPSVKPEPTAVTPSASADETKPAPATPLPTEQQPSAASTEQVATATTPEKLLNPTRLLIIGAVFVVLAVATFLLIRRRAHADTRISLITRSMDQNKE